MSASTNDLPRDFDDRFRIERRLGRGGMGDVYKAYDTVLERTVAVKTLTPGNADPQAVERLLREARACARLTHPGIVTIHDVLQAEGSVHIVMEHLEGTSLESLNRSSRFAAPDAKIDVLARILDALHYAHGRGVVHRDIKPSNVQLLPDGSVKLLDFGIAHVAGAAALTVTGTMTGTVHYASPEQLRGEESDASTDVYSTGILAYEVLTGRRPFDGDSIAAVVTKALNDALPPMGTTLGGESSEIEGIVRRATAKRSCDRYASAGDMKNALTACLAARAATAPAAGAVAEAPTAVAVPAAGAAVAPAAAGVPEPPTAASTALPAADSGAPAPLSPRPRRRLPAAAAAAVLVLLAGVALLDPVWGPASSDDALPSAAGPSVLDPAPRPVAAGMDAPSASSAAGMEASAVSPAAGMEASAALSAAGPASPPAGAPASAPAEVAADGVAAAGRAESARAASAAPGPPPAPGPAPPAPGLPPAPPPASPAGSPPPSLASLGAKDLYYAATSPAGAGEGSSPAGAEGAAAAGLRYRVLRRAPAGAAVEVDADTVFRSGDRIRFAFEPNVDGFLYVIQRGSTGRWSVLLPHPQIDGGRNAVTRFAEVTVPSEGWFRFDENPGSEEVFVYLSRERIRTLPWGGGTVVSAQSVEQPTVIELANSVRTRDLVFEKEDAPDGPERAAYVVNQDAVGHAVAWTVELHHR